MAIAKTQIKLSKKLAGAKLMESKCGKYITNGHWLALKELVSFDSRWIDADSHKPPADQVMPKNQLFPALTHVTVRTKGSLSGNTTFLLAEKINPIAIDTAYLDFFLKLGEFYSVKELKIGVTDSMSPISLESDGVVLAIIMPTRDEDTLPDIVAAFAKTVK